MTARVELGDRSYDIHVGRGLLGRIDEFVRPREHCQQVAVVTQGPIAEHHLGTLTAALARLDVPHQVIEVPDGEVAKSTETLDQLWRRFAGLEQPLGRHDLVLALGGGVVGDLAGFAAASWNRGIDLVQVPTTLLAQVDSSIGGKTGINLPEGKNLVGAFHQPVSVVVDVDLLGTLPRRQRVAGLGEVAKYGFIRDPGILDLLEEAGPDAADDLDLLEELVQRSVAVKAAVVSGDERESGQRAHLNFGHTFGHVVESLTGYTTHQHGEAVAIGMAMAVRLGVHEGITPPELIARVDRVCEAVGLPSRAPQLDQADLWTVLARDKKAQSGVRWVLLEGLGEVVVRHADKTAVERAIQDVTS